eukprot:CAMPEP_0194270376 /NCGR_PEP_ID=MMETSP0169-20130528/4363_1 /TAXON_ID=218684 /ORGANISM="Corethron pennatum, Strain L29A3" /LENGTH=962 /DNA_ID=CAMNT_0039012397 /DNA_START=176 /DNA_END=3064 /DNA_ORIENTATION=-
MISSTTTSGHYDLSPVLDADDDGSAFDPVDFLNGLFPTEQSLRYGPSHRAGAPDADPGGGLEVLSVDIRRAVDRLDAKIGSGIGSQAAAAPGGAEGIRGALSTLEELRRGLRRVAASARGTTASVRPVVADIRRLDNAKRNLQRSITSLRRLHMLVHAMERLGDAAEDRRYGEASALLAAAREVAGHFEEYRSSVAEVRECFERLGALEGRLEGDVRARFEEAGRRLAEANGEGGAAEEEAEDDEIKVITSADLFAQEDASKTGGRLDHTSGGEAAPGDPELAALLRSVADACSVVDVLGDGARTRQIAAFCDARLECYLEAFRVDGTCAHPAASSLDAVDRRFAFFRTTMKNMEEDVRGIFPAAWNVAYELTLAFLRKTGGHLATLLGESRGEKTPPLGGAEHSAQVAVLLKALQKTVLFEREMTVRLERDYGLRLSAAAARAPATIVDETMEFDADGHAHPKDSAAGIRLRRAREKKASDHRQATAAAAEHAPDSRRREVTVLPPIVAVLSDVFVSSMGPYLSLERHNMSNLISSALADGTVDHRGTELPVFTSSTALFVYIKNSVNRCTVLTRGRTFLDLVAEYQHALDQYADLMLKKMPSPSVTLSQRVTIVAQTSKLKRQGSSTIHSDRDVYDPAHAGGDAAGSAAQPPHQPSTYKIPTGGEVTVCHVVDTCDYCAETGEALAELISDKMDPALRDGVDMTVQVDRFHDVTAKGLQILVSGLESRVDASLRKMANMSWDRLETVGEESPYVLSMAKTIREFCEQVRDLLSNSYYRNFCDKFGAAFIPSFHGAVIRLRRISESGTQQLLLDVYNIKTLVLRLPILGTPGGQPAPAMYTRHVAAEFGRIEMLLKAVGTRPELLVDVFRANWPTGTPADLQTVMGLKGMRRAEQQAILEKFGMEPRAAVHATSSAAAIASEKAAEVSQKLSVGSSAVAARMGSDLVDMRRKVEELRKQFS